MALFMTDYVGAKFYTEEDNYGFYFNFGLPFSVLYQEFELYVTLAVACASFAVYCVVILLLKKVIRMLKAENLILIL